MKKRKLGWNQSTVIAIILSVLISIVIIGSNRYMATCIETEVKAQEERYELTQLGQLLANTSDYLTDEVRKFAVSGDEIHVINYWNEVYNAKNRDSVIEEISKYNIPFEEEMLLQEAKKNSDLLITTEIYAMALSLKSKGKTIQDYDIESTEYVYYKRIFSEELPYEYTILSKEDMKQKSIEILYDNEYITYKDKIMKPIEQFRLNTNVRMNEAVLEAIKGREVSSKLQTSCVGVIVAFLLMIFFFITQKYIYPIQTYILEMEEIKKVVPKGAKEMERFGTTYNILLEQVENEMSRSTQAEANMRIARDQANEANRAKTKFLAHMSHELRTPLNGIIGYLHLIEESKSKKKRKEYINGMKLSSTRLLELINQVLDFSKIESEAMIFQKKVFSLETVVKEVTDILKSGAIEKGIELQVLKEGNISDDLIGDSLRLSQVLMNLIGNGIKCTKDGSVKLHICSEKISDGEKILFRISDTGCGISPENLDRIFLPFEQAESSREVKVRGTGLGLSICKRIVEEASNGQETLHVYSEVGKGTIFSFIMEFKTNHAIKQQKSKKIYKKSDISNLKDKKILLVDDNVENLFVEGEILRSFGVKVFNASSGKEAIEKIKKRKEKYDLIFMDVRMPDMDGYETTYHIRTIEEYDNVPIVFLTADIVPQTIDEIIKVGGNAYLEKPIQVEELKICINKYLTNQLPVKYFHELACLQVLGGSEDKVAQLIQLFMENHTEKSVLIQKAITEKNQKELRQLCHGVKGVLASMHCELIVKCMNEIQNQIYLDEEEAVTQFVFVWNNTINELKEYSNYYKGKIKGV
ncbi:MAG: ATP-binding protein [Lachnospiraceae bacterium]